MGDLIDQTAGPGRWPLPADEASTSIKPQVQGVGARSGKVLRNHELRISIGDDSDVGWVQVPVDSVEDSRDLRW
jgi:hypothetical protein